MIEKPIDLKQLLDKMDLALLIETLQLNLANILHLPSQIAKELDKKVFFLVKAIDTTIDIFIPKARFCSKLILGFDKKCKNAQMRARKLKKYGRKKIQKRVRRHLD